jgi:hypothetical protein
MALSTSNTSKKAFDFLKKKLADKDALDEAIQKGFNIEKVAKERGLRLIRPL